MHQNAFPEPRGSLQRSPGPLAGFWICGSREENRAGVERARERKETEGEL